MTCMSMVGGNVRFDEGMVKLAQHVLEVACAWHAWVDSGSSLSYLYSSKSQFSKMHLNKITYQITLVVTQQIKPNIAQAILTFECWRCRADVQDQEQAAFLALVSAWSWEQCAVWGCSTCKMLCRSMTVNTVTCLVPHWRRGHISCHKRWGFSGRLGRKKIVAIRNVWIDFLTNATFGSVWGPQTMLKYLNRGPM